MHDMTADEQQQYVTHLRSLRTSAQSFSKSLNLGTKPAKKASAAKSEKTASIDILSAEYDV